MTSLRVRSNYQPGLTYPIVWKSGGVTRIREMSGEELLREVPAQRKPLTDEEKLALLKKHFNAVCVPEWFDALLLDIEAAHGIKENT